MYKETEHGFSYKNENCEYFASKEKSLLQISSSEGIIKEVILPNPITNIEGFKSFICALMSINNCSNK